MAAPLPEVGLAGSVRHRCNAEGARTGRYTLPPRWQGGRGSLLPRRNDRGHRAVVPSDTSRIPGDHLLRLQAVRKEGWYRNGQYRLGDVPRRRDSIRIHDFRHVAYPHGTANPHDRNGHQRPRFQHHPGLPPPSRRCPDRDPSRLPDRAPDGTPASAPSPPVRERRPGGPRPGRHRPGHGHIHPLRAVLGNRSRVDDHVGRLSPVPFVSRVRTPGDRIAAPGCSR